MSPSSALKMDKSAVSIFRVFDGNSILLQKVGFYQPVHTAL
jgi:hypothetical protein